MDFIGTVKESTRPMEISFFAMMMTLVLLLLTPVVMLVNGSVMILVIKKTQLVKNVDDHYNSDEKDLA